MNIDIYASGSTGNCYRVADGRTTLLIECGLPIQKIKEATGFRLSAVDGCLLSHGHQDHAHSAKEIMAHGIDLWTSGGTAAELGLVGYRLKTVAAGQQFSIGTFRVVAFDTIHDTTEPLGFLIYSTVTREKLLFVTDSAYLPHRFGACDFLMVECNYITEYVDDEIAGRLMKSHMSLETCVQFLRAQDLSRCKRIYLIHISRDRGDQERMKREVQRATGKEVILA